MKFHVVMDSCTFSTTKAALLVRYHEFVTRAAEEQKKRPLIARVWMSNANEIKQAIDQITASRVEVPSCETESRFHAPTIAIGELVRRKFARWCSSWSAWKPRRSRSGAGGWLSASAS